MARFGLLMQNNCIWNTDTLLRDTAYIRQMTNTSQSLNLSYGYLWWLNGKTSFMLPTTQFVFSGSYAPAAPSDMFSGLGKNGQIVSVSRSAGLVVVRMGNQANGAEVSAQLCNSIWEKLNAVMCIVSSINETNSTQENNLIYPNPANTEINIGLNSTENSQIEILNSLGEVVIKKQNQNNIDISNLTNGLYIISVKQNQKIAKQKFIKQ